MSAVRKADCWADPVWRISNIYEIVDKSGRVVPFRPNWAQQEFLERYNDRTLVLKARQLGLSTLIGIIQLDTCLFTSNVTAATIAHDRDSLEKLFARNIKGVYERLPEAIRQAVPASRDRTHQLRFGNGSDISVTLSARSGTVQMLHVSEFGKLCAKYPQKAQEVVTGAFEAVPADGCIIIESTAEGQSGYFYDYCMDAIRGGQEGRTSAWNLLFFPWHQHPEYRAKKRGPIQASAVKYFGSLVERGIELDQPQQHWYAQKLAALGEDIKREHPSFAEEAFESSTEGAYYADQMARARTEGRITKVPYQAGLPVETWWDLGMDDSTAIWWAQRVGREIHLIDYYEASGEGLQHYAEVLDAKRKERPMLYSRHIAPHDIKVRELGTGLSRLETAASLGIPFEVCPMHAVADRIEAVRNGLSLCWFDSDRTQQGTKALDSYRKEWDDARGTWRNKPLHDWSSHCCDAFGLGFMADPARTSKPAAQPVTRKSW